MIDMEALQEIVNCSDTTSFTEFSKREWKTVNDALGLENDACFNKMAKILSYVSIRDFPKSANPIDLCLLMATSDDIGHCQRYRQLPNCYGEHYIISLQFFPH